MRSKLAAGLSMAFFTSIALGQTPAGGSAAARGRCSLAGSGSGSRVAINCGVGVEQGRKMVEILNKILANQIDPAAVMVKLDEISKAAPHPAQAQTCVGSAGGQGTLNQYGAAKLTMTDAQRDLITRAMRPFSGITVTIFCPDATQDSMAYANQLAAGLRAAGIVAQGPNPGAGSGASAVPSGVSLGLSEDRVPAGSAMISAMTVAGLLPKATVPAGRIDGTGRFAITIAPNR